MALSENLLQLLVCPRCRGDLTVTGDESGLVCDRCHLRYPVRDGIPVMLADEAEKIA